MSVMQTNWCHNEFSSVDLGDDRLNKRFIEVASNLLDNPGSPIVEASQSWNEAKAAYRLFDNEKLSDAHIKELHQSETVIRLNQQDDEIFLAIQDTTTLNYTHHPKKKGLEKINKNPGYKNPSKGCFLHNTLLMTESGLPLGLIDQKIYQHIPRRIKHKQRPITEKESYRWLESLHHTKELCGEKTVITVADRESDIYEFFDDAQKLNAKILIRASKDRILVSEKGKKHDTLWSFMKKQKIAATLNIEIPEQRYRSRRQAEVEVRFSEVEYTPPQRAKSARVGKLEKVKLNVIWIYENSCNEDNDKLEWMLLTNVAINNVADAQKAIQWYKLRWQIECYHRVLKSGCKVEDCRLESYERLKKYLALKSVIAYRLFNLTHMNRVNPEESCENILMEHEWKALYCKVQKTSQPIDKPPTIREAVRMIAKMGGFAGRNSDGEPGMTTIWRGWQKLTELSELWLIINGETYG